MIRKPKNLKQALPLIALLLALVAAAGLVFFYFQIKGLKSRASSLESKVVYKIDEDEAGRIDYQVISQSAKDLRVEKEQDYHGEYKPEYEIKKVRIIRVKISNNTEYLHFHDSFSLSGVNKDGLLIDSIAVHPDDTEGKTYFGIAPGGSYETEIYIADDGQEIKSLYDSMNNRSLSL